VIENYLQSENITILPFSLGIIKKGQMSAIMGPSGSGKTTLMTTLAGRQDLEWSGYIAANKSKIDPVQFRKNIAFVLQEESLFATQTPREALKFSAQLRLTGKLTEQEQNERVENILKILDLESCADSLIGNELIRGLSGGEKRRVTIGVEFITDPKILFLDEPTSGLDASSAYSVVRSLKMLCRRGCSVVTTIHQPSSEAFHAFDKCFILVNGETVYGGSISQLNKTLVSIGAPCPATYNLADHIISVVKQKGPKGENDIKCLRMEWVKIAPNTEIKDTGDSNLNMAAKCAEFEIRSGFFQQLNALLVRDTRNVIRDVDTLGFRIAATIFLNVLFGVVFLGVGNDDVIQSRYGKAISFLPFSRKSNLFICIYICRRVANDSHKCNVCNFTASTNVLRYREGCFSPRV